MSLSRATTSSQLVEAAISSELYEEVLSGRTTRERKLAVCSGSAGLAPAERAELLAVLSEDADNAVRERAENALLSQSVDAFAAALAGEAPAPQLFRYCGQNLADKPAIAVALLKSPRCPVQFLTSAVRALPTSVVQEFMQDLDLLSSNRALVAALVGSPSLTVEQRQQLEELLADKVETEAAFAEAVGDIDTTSEQRATLLQRLAGMRIVERVQLALKGNREERMALIRDPCKVVQRAVLQSSRLTDREVETFASMASLTDEILRVIANSRKFRRNYSVVMNLMNNPKTPIDITLHILPSITAPDLKKLATNRNVAETLRSAAMRLQAQRTQVRD
jgi:hypothetical protein